MWGDEAHLPAWPAGPAQGVTARAVLAAWEALRRFAHHDGTAPERAPSPGVGTR